MSNIKKKRKGAGAAPMYLPILALLILLAVDFYLNPTLQFSTIIALAFIIIVWAVVIGGWLWLLVRGPKVNYGALSDDDLPIISILLPVYREANMLGQLTQMLYTLDYPSDKLNCMVLMESDDSETMTAATTHKWPHFCQLMTIDRCGPKTKARACNYVLDRKQSDIIVIFDAEDRPHPQQLREAATYFAANDETLACLQAPLRIQPSKGDWLQYQFALEYKLLFGFILPGLSVACAVLPLGGSSNYFRTHILRKLGGWDDYNLTEDAELGLRLAQGGYRTGTLRHPTIENAPHKVDIWHTQRTRWLSGHIQTLHTHAKPPLHQPRYFIRWLIYCLVLISRLVSGPLHGLAIFATVKALFLPIPSSALDASFVHIWVGLAGYGIILCLLIVVSPASHWWGRLFLAMTHPIYWLMTLPALLNAMKRMAMGQFGWLKSDHKPYRENKPASEDKPFVEEGVALEREKGIEPSS